MNCCCICGTVKNCSQYIDKVIENMEEIGNTFVDYKILLYYDKSNDDTLYKLSEHQKRNDKIMFYVNRDPVSDYRTHNIAKGRNYCLHQIRYMYSNYSYFIMMDCDDVSSCDIDVYVLKKWIERDDEWDALSFNRKPYYDIWALSISKYLFSCYHFENTYEQDLFQYITYLMDNTDKNDLIPCYSAFNGFSIYKTHKFINCEYRGDLLFDFVPIKKLMGIFGPITYKIFPNEDCEHRRFHYEAIDKNNAKIRISVDMLFKGELNSNTDEYLNNIPVHIDHHNNTKINNTNNRNMFKMITT